MASVLRINAKFTDKIVFDQVMRENKKKNKRIEARTLARAKDQTIWKYRTSNKNI